MTFADMLRLLEDYGPVTDGDPRGWAKDRINGDEFARKGIKDKHVSQDNVMPEKKLRKSAKDLYCGGSRKRNIQPDAPIGTVMS